MILSAQTIKNRTIPYGIALTDIIYPFKERYVVNGNSAGLSHCGYDVTIAEDIIIYPITLKYLVLNQFADYPSAVLASTVEHFYIPTNIAAVVMDKSSWARRFIAVQNTICEPGFKGFLTLEITNHSNKVVKIIKGSAIAQIVFHYLDQDTDYPYSGKYQDQKAGPQPAVDYNLSTTAYVVKV